MRLFGTRSPPFANFDGILMQAKCSKIKEREEGWRSGKKLPFKRTTVCACKMITKSRILGVTLNYKLQFVLYLFPSRNGCPPPETWYLLAFATEIAGFCSKD